MALYDKTYAPGANFVGEDRMYYRLSGTSFAAPFVAGVASLIFSIDPSLKPEQVKRMILQSARDLEVPGHDQFTGYGLLDARAALAADPNRYVDARITGVGLFRQDGRPVLVPTGTAAADRMKRAWLEVGKGKQPSAWTRASEDMTKPVENGQLAPMPVRHFPGPGDYVLRLVVEHADGATREARHELNLR
jgi:subtilisin family serine protease